MLSGSQYNTVLYNMILRTEGLLIHPPRQNGRHFRDDIFRCIFVKKVLYFDWNFTVGS